MDYTTAKKEQLEQLRKFAKTAKCEFVEDSFRNKYYFVFENDISDSNLESITSKEANDLEDKMMDIGFDGALLEDQMGDFCSKTLCFEMIELEY